MDKVQIELTVDEAKQLSSLLTMLTAHLSYRASKTPDGSLDEAWQFWHDISKKVSFSFGYQSWMEPTQMITNVLNVTLCIKDKH